MPCLTSSFPSGRSSGLLLPCLVGFAKADGRIVTLAYDVVPAIDAFARLKPRIWGPLANDQMKILKAARFDPSGLPADWLDIKGKGVVEPAEGRDQIGRAHV